VSATGGRFVDRKLGRSSTVRELVGRAIGRGGADLAALVGRDGEITPEYLHDVRVATRRLRSDLRTLSGVLDPPASSAVRDELRWFADVLGAVRDNDVLIEILDSMRPDLVKTPHGRESAQLDELISYFRRCRSRALEDLHRAVASPRGVALIDQLTAMAAEPPLREGVRARDRARPHARDSARRGWKGFARVARANLGSASVDDVHEIRKRAKRARYAAELASPVFRGRPDRLARRLTGVQTVLGEHQDMVVLEERLLDLPPLVAASSSFAVGQLVQLARARRAVALGDWPRVYRRVRDPALRRWLKPS
jgi:CHAD domain-containing protein